MKPKAIIPFKKERAKSRLGGVLSEKEREEFAVRMLGDVLVALSESEIEEVKIISTCSEEQIKEDLKLGLNLELNSKLTVREDGRGLNEVLNEEIKDEKEPVLIIMADVPLATPESINEIVSREEDVVITPGREGGTNALFLRKPYKFAVSYYGISCLKHIETARRQDLSYAIHDSFFISTDIDEVDDLIELLIHGGSRSRSFSAEYLRGIGVSIHADNNSKMRAKVKVSVGR
ncbi:2-phospho-L-lactate guanylyltransferase [ANME-1 cluster archaeon GoMg1]|nr:2-phospho-L-lactate guanylyltransferase [ANME-1 cluster archaeon GoMg1]VUT25973.1 MAG: 2-phospho-L-lactate guanylyltransferase [Candidatus Methanolliviera sp. GoM_asphalt]